MDLAVIDQRLRNFGLGAAAIQYARQIAVNHLARNPGAVADAVRGAIRAASRRFRYRNGADLPRLHARLGPLPGPTAAPEVMPGTKRARSGEAVKDVSGYIQLRQSKNSVGRLLRRQEYLNRMVELNVVSQLHRWQKLSATGAAVGQFKLGNLLSGTAPNRLRAMPIYVFELNSLKQNYNSFDSTLAMPFARLRYNENGSLFQWNTQYGYKNDGTTAQNELNAVWQDERVAYGANNSNLPYERAMIDWADITVNMWGATSDPSAVEVFICRFVDPDVAPPAAVCSSTYVTNTPLYPVPDATSDPAKHEKYYKWWAAFTDQTNGNFSKKLTYNKTHNGLKVLYYKRFDFNPTATYETDTAGHQVSHKIFHRINEMTSYIGDDDFNQSHAQLGFDALADPNCWPSNVTAKAQIPYAGNPRARLFLMIRGFNAVADTETAASSPSFDLLVRRKMSFVS